MENKVMCLEFNCDDNLSQYTDSMLFDSGTVIASGKFEKEGRIFNIYLEVNGEVAVTYKGEVYHSPSDFPEELTERIRNTTWWDVCSPSEEGDDVESNIYVGMNNWFEYLYGEECIDDGTVYEADLSRATKEEIFEDMRYIAEHYF